MNLTVKRWLTFHEQIPGEDSTQADLHKVALCAVLDNPYAGQGYVDDLSPLIQASVALGHEMGERIKRIMEPYGVQSYGKAGLVGVNGEQEHANALLTSDFANPVRDAIGGGQAWIASVTKCGAPGTTIDVPLAHKDALYVRSHYNNMTLQIADAPGPNEVVIIMAFANRGRLNARVGGLKHEEIDGSNGLT